MADIDGTQHRELFRRELWNRRELHAFAGVQRVANGDAPRIDDTDDVARKCFGNGFPVAPEEPVDARHAERGVEPRVHDRHVFGEPPRADAQERDTIAVTRVHVRLDLEDEAREIRIGRLDGADVRGARARARRQREQRVKKRLDAEVVQRAAEEDRCLLRAAIGVPIESRAGAGDDRNGVDQLLLAAIADQLVHFRRVGAGHDNR